MTIKNLKTALLAAISIIWAGCDKDASLNDTYSDIILYVSETTVWETTGSSDAPPVEYMQIREIHNPE